MAIFAVDNHVPPVTTEGTLENQYYRVVLDPESVNTASRGRVTVSIDWHTRALPACDARTRHKSIERM